MKQKKQFPIGSFSWVDLATTDLEAAKKFYSAILGWKDLGGGTPENFFYTFMGMNAETQVCAFFPINEEMKKKNIPTHWKSYVSVESVESVAQKVTENGGEVLMGPMEVFDAGIMLTFRDPGGAILNVWEAKNHAGAPPMDNAPGSFSWNELQTHNFDEVTEFYQNVFDWEIEKQEGPCTYASLKNHGRNNGGIVKIDPSWGENIPSHWQVYFTVENCDEATQRVKDLGGVVLKETFDLPDNIGRMSVVQDPQGGVFSLIHLLAPEKN